MSSQADVLFFQYYKTYVLVHKVLLWVIPKLMVASALPNVKTCSLSPVRVKVSSWHW